MKKLLVFIAVCSLSMMATAQNSVLVGAWQQLDADGRPTTQFKYFMPDGKLLGLSYNKDYTNSSVWFMSDYKVLNDSSFVDHAFYHCDIMFQRDYYFTFHLENDSVMATSYVDYRYTGRGVETSERWKKSDRPLPVFTEAEWKALHQKSLAEFERLPSEGETVEQFAQKLYDKAKNYEKKHNLPQAIETMLIRAELDTTNLQWQRDAYMIFHTNKMAPSASEKIADRYIRLKEAMAPVANDTSVVAAYRLKAYLYNYRGNPGMLQVRKTASKAIAMETAAGHQPTLEYGLDYFLMAESYMSEGNFQDMYECMEKCIDILEKAPNVSKRQLGEAYMGKATSMMNTDRKREAIDIILNKVTTLFVDENGQPLPKMSDTVYPMTLSCYESMLSNNPKDKKLLKEYQQFLSDKMVEAVFHNTDKKRNLFGKYYILERCEWTFEKPIANFCPSHMLLMQNGQFVEFIKEQDEPANAMVNVEVVDAATKKDLIKQWKAYKKSKK